MTARSYILILAITCSATIAVTSCQQSKNKRSEQINNTNTPQADTSYTAILPFNKKYSYPFDSSFNPTSLTRENLTSIDSLLITCVTHYNNSLDSEHKGRSIDLKKTNYYKQIIAVINKKGEKEVWINCLCNISGIAQWRTELLVAEDGGNCYFSFKANLAIKKIYHFSVNGLA